MVSPDQILLAIIGCFLLTWPAVFCILNMLRVQTGVFAKVRSAVKCTKGTSQQGDRLEILFLNSLPPFFYALSLAVPAIVITTN